MPESLLDLGHNIANQLGLDTKDSLWLIKTYPLVVGELAKACESVDHLESYQYRESIADCVIRICSLMLAAASHLNLDIATEVSNRLAGVKEKSIFFDHHKSSRT
jgi:NTP pyrophosphatase (non-canonical NTP hydrolase)